MGALIMTTAMARRPSLRQVGLRMFQAVIAFGLATVVFAASHNLWLSIGTLIVMGAADTVNVMIRVSLVQLITPDKMADM